MKKNIKQAIKIHQQGFLPIVEKYIRNKNLLDVGCGNGLNSFFLI